MYRRPDALSRLRQLNAEEDLTNQPELSEDNARKPPVRPFTGVKSSWWRNPLEWFAQITTEGKLQTEVHGNSLRNQAERVKAFDDAHTRAEVLASKVLEIMVDDQTERRGQRQLRRAATNDGIETGDAITTVAGYVSLQRPELEKMLEGLPQALKAKFLSEYDLVAGGIVTRLRMNVHGLKDEPVHFDRQELT